MLIQKDNIGFEWNDSDFCISLHNFQGSKVFYNFPVFDNRLTVLFYGLSVCVGYSHIIRKLKDLVPVLVNSFQEFIPLVLTKENLDGKSFGCMASILHSIDLIVRSFVHGYDKKLEFSSSNGRDDMGVWDVTVSSAFLKKLFPLFPLDPVHHLSEKVLTH